MIVDIIIVKYNIPELEKKCIESVIKYTNNISYHLTIYDNYVYRHNLGQLWNRLIRRSDSDYICLINPDTIVESDWLSKLLQTFNCFEESVGCVGPSTDNSKNQQSKLKPNKDFVDFGTTFPGWVLSGFCLLFPKKVWEEVGGFPEDFGFYGQEVVFIDKIVKKGYKQIWRTDVFVHHEGGASIKKAQSLGEINELEERKKGRENYLKFREKLKNEN
jgi:GT2 family glycosyltransferase